jgi:hypothetical protein
VRLALLLLLHTPPSFTSYQSTSPTPIPLLLLLLLLLLQLPQCARHPRQAAG